MIMMESMIFGQRKSFLTIIRVKSETIEQSSDSQPGCRGTLGCREKVPGVPPTFGFGDLQIRVPTL